MMDHPDWILKLTEKDEIYLEACSVLAKMSKCPRLKGHFAAMLVDKEGRVKGHGYNGTVSGASNLCGDDYCLRDGIDCDGCNGTGIENNTTHTCTKCMGRKYLNGIKSGTQLAIGCIHAEVNLIINCERADLDLGTVYVNGEPCELCAKYLSQSGIVRLVYIKGGYSTHKGIDVLEKNGIACVGKDPNPEKELS